MKRGPGEHLKKGETKQNIIEFIASSPSLVVKETEIRDYLIEKHNIREPKNIKEQLKDLSEENLIKKVKTPQGSDNKWSIENVIQLQGIVKKYNVLTKILQKNDKIISMLIDHHFQKPFLFKESYEMWKTFDECDQCLRFPQRPEGIDCNFNEDERKKCIEVASLYLFNWEKIPGNDNGRLIEFLKGNFSIEWVNSAKIEKIDNDKTIKISTEKNSLLLILNDGKTEVNLQIDDRTAGQFIAKTENGELNIYENYLVEDERITGKEKKMLSDDKRYLNVREISALNEMAKKASNSTIDFDNNKFKEYLRISPCFFKMCLKTSAEFNTTFKKIFQLTMTKCPNNVELQNCFAIEAQKFKWYDKILEICVHTDIINKEASEEAIEYVHNMKRNTE